jgi:branched-chain amino acid transport system ATP-binding protein
VRIGDVELSELAPHRRLEAGVSLVPQGRCNFPQMSVVENLQLAVYTMPRAERNDAIDRVLGQFPALVPHRRRHAGHLSGGQQQMLETAMAMAVRPRALLIDEPSLGLSPRARVDVFDSLRSIADEGVTVVMVEQNVVEGLAASDHAVVMVEGRIDRHGPAQEVLADPEMKAVFLGGRPGEPHEDALPDPEPIALQERP